MPAASAGSNGAYEPPPPHLREQLQAVRHPVGSAEDAALLVGDAAIAPFTAPPEIQAAISAANQSPTSPTAGAAATARGARGNTTARARSATPSPGGMLGAPATSGQLMNWGSPGRGRWLTVYANPGHVYAVIAGLRWDTVGNASGEGPRWHPADAYPSGYVARHIPGL